MNRCSSCNCSLFVVRCSLFAGIGDFVTLIVGITDNEGFVWFCGLHCARNQQWLMVSSPSADMYFGLHGYFRESVRIFITGGHISNIRLEREFNQMLLR